MVYTTGGGLIYMERHMMQEQEPYKSPFPGVLGDAVYYRTYSRPYRKPDAATAMETWEENARRCSRFLAKLGDLTPAQEQAIYEYQCRLQVTPPGRVLWAAVEHWVERDGYPNYLGLFNCFSLDTTFITREGIKTFKDYRVGDSLQVVGIDGTWCDATIVSGGTQPLVGVWLEKGSTRKYLKATPNHRWFRHVDGDTYEETTELAVGDYLLSVNGTRKGERPDPVAIAQGIAYSRMMLAGTALIEKRKRTLSLYGEEVEVLPYLVPWVGDNYEVVTTNDKGEITQYRVVCPEEVAPTYGDVSHTLGFLMGVLTRGYSTLGSDGTMVLPVEEHLLPWLTYATALLGIEMGAPYRNGGGRHYVRLSFPGPYDGMKYLLLKRHREAFREQVGGSMWRVVSIEPADPEEVWCLQVPRGEAFLLGGGLYTGNCVGIRPTSWRWFGYNFLLLMMGCGVGELLELDNVSMLPPINSTLPELVVTHLPGTHSTRPEHTTSTLEDGVLTIHVGDSKEGWVDSYVLLLEVCSDPTMVGVHRIEVDLGGVRPQGEPIKGFGGTANPSALPDMYRQVMVVLEGARGRQITTFEASLLENETAKATVAGNIRRSAKWIGYGHDDPHMVGAKDNLWQENEDGVWVVDPKRDALRMSNISAIYHRKPTLEECVLSVKKQYLTGEGALWLAPVALVRSNVDLLVTQRDREEFERAYTVLGKETARSYLRAKMYAMGRDDDGIEVELDHRMLRYGANPCAEVLGHNFVCSLSQVDLSRFDVNSPTLWDDIDAALDTAALIVCALLKRGFAIPELQESRETDPIVAVTLNGVFDFMVNLWGDPWLRWWMAGCPEYWVDPMGVSEAQDFIEATKLMLMNFRDRVRDAVTAYCTEHNLKVPNRYTAMQPSGSKSCLTGGTPACYTPKGMYWVRRVTFRRDHPVALAAIALGYKVVPSTSCKDEYGVLLDDPYDVRVPEWLVEIPQECTWSSNVEGTYDVAHAPIESQWYLTMAVQEHFVTHNTSVTYEIDEGEVVTLAKLIHDEIAKGGHYVSGAVYARDYSPMPRMPYEPITREQYEQMLVEVSGRRNPEAGGDFKTLVEYYYNLDTSAEVGPEVGCDGGACALPDVP